jgi:hypothetical protein
MPLLGDQPVPSVHTPTARSIVDALYRGDAVGAKKLFVDYVKSAPTPVGCVFAGIPCDRWADVRHLRRNRIPE